MMSEAQRFDLVAATQILIDADVTRCWELLRAAILQAHLHLDNLRPAIDQLRAGTAVTLGALTLTPTDDHVEVALNSDRRTCLRAELLEELDRLAERSSSIPRTGQPPTAAPPPVTTTPPPPAAPPVDPPDLLALLASLLGTTPDQLAGDPAAYRAQVERVRVAVTRLRTVAADPKATAAQRAAAEAEVRALFARTGEHAGETAAARTSDLAGTARALGIDTQRIADALRVVSDWLEQRTPAAGEAVDRLVDTLETLAAPFLGRTAAQAEHDERLRADIRDAIAARIKPTA